MTTFCFDNPSTHGVYRSATLNDSTVTIDGTSYPITWHGDAEFLNDPKPYMRWGKQGVMHTDDGDVHIMLAWEQYKLDVEDAEDACDWDDPDYLYIDGQQLDRARSEARAS